MMHFGIPELLILLFIIILLFGVGRIGKIAGELGKGINSFRAGLTGKDGVGSDPVSDEKSGKKEESNSQ